LHYESLDHGPRLERPFSEEARWGAFA